MTLTFLTEESLVAAGHDCEPVLFTGNASGWEFSRSLDDASAKSSAPRASVGRLNNEAFNRFKAADSRGVPSVGAKPGEGKVTVHQNTITSVRPYAGQSGNVTKVSTSGVDGKLVVWTVGK